MVNNWFATGSELLNSLRPEIHGIEVTYVQDGITITNLPVAVEHTDDDSALAAGLIRVDSRNYIIEKALLVAGGIAGHPTRGATITESDGTVQVPMSEGNQDVWDWHDQSKTAYELRCKTITEP